MAPPTVTKTTESIQTPLDVDSLPSVWHRKNGILLYALISSSLLTTAAVGLDQSMTNNMQELTQWQDRFGSPTGSKLGLFGASSSIGGIVPFLFLSWIGDKWGRRLPTFLGSVIVIAGALIEFFAITLNIYIGGKILLGAGASILQMGAPILVTELSHPKERVRVTTFYNTSIVLGYVIGAWTTFGTAKINSDWAWKLPTLLQVLPSAYQLVAIYFCPESPRWLVAHDKLDQARRVLVKYHGECRNDSPVVDFELAEIQQAIAMERANTFTWRQFVETRGNLKRIALCLSVAVFTQTSGNNLVSNYITEILKATGVKSETDVTLVNGMITIWQYIVCIGNCFLVDRLKRRTFFVWGSGGVTVVFIAWTIAAEQYLAHNSLVGGRIVLACIFLFQGFYTFAWTNVSITYQIEITTYEMRAKTWSLALLVIQCASLFNSYVNPIGLANVGWKYYIYYDVWVFMIFLIVYFFFVETSGPTLEELTYLFDGEDAKHKRSLAAEEAEKKTEESAARHSHDSVAV